MHRPYFPREICNVGPDTTVVMYGVTRGSVKLACNTSAISEENYPMLVMWFKDDNLNPFYR